MSTHASGGTTARQRSGSGTGSGTGSGAKGRGGESAIPRAWTAEERARAGLRQEKSSGDLDLRHVQAWERYDPRAPLDPYFLQRVYEDDQLAHALNGYSRQKLAEAVAVVQARHPGTGPKDSRSKNSMIRYVTRVVTGGRYSAEFLPEASGTRAKNGESKRAQARAARATGAVARSSTRTSAATPKAETLTPIRTASTFHYDPRAGVDPYALHYYFGAGQLRQALTGYSMQRLKEGVARVQEHNPGTRPRSMSRKADMIDYMVEQVSANPRDFAYSERV